MSFTHPRGERPGAYNPAWYAGMIDQAMRSLDVGRPERAARIAETLFGLSPSGFTAALRLEGLRQSGQEDAARAFLESMPERALHSPVLLLVQALRARDRGQDLLASNLMSEAARGIHTPGVRAALLLPPAEWPRSLRELLAEIPDGAAGALGPAPPSR
jgi:hypothetical protein